MRPSSLRHVASWLLAALLSSTAPGVFGDSLRYGANADLMYDSNVPRGPTSADQKSDWIASAEGYLGKSVMLGERSGMVFRAGARYAQFKEFRDISNLAISGRAAYRVQPAAGFSAPWLELAGDLQWLNHGDSELRDGWIGSLSASVGSYLTDRIRATFGGGATERNSDSATGLYDLSTQQMWATLDYRVGIRSTLYGRLGYVTGDHVFNAVSAASQTTLSAYSQVIAADPALARGFGGIVPIGYRIDANTQTYELGYNHPLGGNHTLDFFVRGYSSKTDVGGLKYDGYQIQAAYLYRFQ